MSEVGNLYDNGPISPICKIKENISVLTGAEWGHYRVEFIEPIPRGPAAVVEMIFAAGLTTLGAGGLIAKRIVPILQVNDLEMLHLRWEPLDNVEGVLWERAADARFNSRSIQSRVDKLTYLRDPYLATTTFWVIGLNRDMNLEVRNPLAVAISQARFQFFGFRMLLKDWTTIKTFATADKALLSQGDVEAVKRLIGTSTWLPAEGRA